MIISNKRRRAATGYARLVVDGHYADAPSGLWGKFDNVRCNWENQISRFSIRPALKGLLNRTDIAERGLRVADLGCGAGEGWELLTKVPVGPNATRKRYLLGPNDIAAYHGIDLCSDMVAQASRRFANIPQASFATGDLADLHSGLEPHQPFDLYYNSYGSLSHLNDEQLRKMIEAVLAHQPGPGALMIDVHGQFSPEWPGYWGYSRNPETPCMQPYNMIWMYPEAERQARLEEQRNYRIRYWRGEEIRRFLGDIGSLNQRTSRITLFDRSVLVGRHMDTGSFHPEVKPLRRAVNALFEFNQVSSAEDLRAESLPSTGDEVADAFFATYLVAWNTLADWFEALVIEGEATPSDELCAPRGPVPAELKIGMEALVEQVSRLAWFNPGDPEANLLQPQFGLLLRQLEIHAQQGLGCGHGLLAVVEFGPAGQSR